MKKKSRGSKPPARRRSSALPGQCLVGAALLVGAGLAPAADEDTSKFEGPEEAGNNWVELSAGGMIPSGSRSQAEQSLQLPGTAFGGIQDLHLQKDVAKSTTFSLDGRGIFDNHDYGLSLSLQKEEAYFLKFNYENFRTYYNANGGYFPPTDSWYPYPYSDDALSLDRGEVSIEGGLLFEKYPDLTFKYSHLYRDGQKSSTIWGQTHPGLSYPSRGLTPSFYDMDETRDIFALDARHQIKDTELGLGVRYEMGDLNNSLNISQYPGEPPVGGVPQDRKITDGQDVSYDLFNVHAFSETWIKKNLFFSAGFLFANLNNNVTGNRIYGDTFDAGYTPNAGNGAGYTNLVSSAQGQEYVLNLNLMSTPTPNLTLVPSVRVRQENWNSDSSTTLTLGNTTSGPLLSNGDGDALDVTEQLDLRYGGITNWVFFAQGEWTQGQGDRQENGGIYLGAPIQRDTEDDRFFQKYSAGVKWYPARRVSMSVGGYYRDNKYDYDNTVDNTPNTPGSANRYPAYLVMQQVQTYDGNAQLTWRPLRNLSLVTRYEYQLSTVNTQPDSVSGLSDVQSADITSQLIGQNISWSPWSRLYLQVGFNFVLSETETPAADYSPALPNAQNNYWTLNFNAGFVLDDKTDLNLGYTYYDADNYVDNSPYVSYGAGGQEHGVNLTLVRRLTERLRLTLRYGYYHYTDQTSGGNNDYAANVVYSSVQYRF